MALDALINAALMRQFLKQNAPPVDPKELDARMAELAAGLKMQNKSLADFCREMNQTEEQLKANLAGCLQWYAYAQKHVNDRDVEKYYLDNKDMFDKVTVRASEIVLRVPPQASESERCQVRAQLTEIRKKIVTDPDPNGFAKAAKQYSQGETKDQGGDLDWICFVRGIRPDGVLKAVFSLQPGQVSEVIDSEEGVHLIKVVDRKAGEPTDFAKIKEEVRLSYMDEVKLLLVSQLRRDAKITINQP
jgi:parvulin-like peptidyl-prolyl isomerase